MVVHPEVALLAPVPNVFLKQGQALCESRKGKVAFGSRAWELFRDLDDIRCGADVDVYIYASQIQGPPAVTWRARYIGAVEGINGAHPEGYKYRPEFVKADGEDRNAYWAIFWEVADLKPLDEPIAIKDLHGFKTGKGFSKTLIPEGPMLIERP